MGNADLRKAARVLLQRNAALLYGFPMPSRAAIRPAVLVWSRFQRGQTGKRKVRVRMAVHLTEP